MRHGGGAMCQLAPARCGPMRVGAMPARLMFKPFVSCARPVLTRSPVTPTPARRTPVACRAGAPKQAQQGSPEGPMQRVRGGLDRLNSRFRPPRYLWRTVAAVVLAGQSITRILQGGWAGGREVWSRPAGPPAAGAEAARGPLSKQACTQCGPCIASPRCTCVQGRSTGGTRWSS